MEHPENSKEYKGLAVNEGVEQPSVVNPYLHLRKRPKRRQFTAAEYVEGIVKGDITVLSQAVTLVESVLPEHQALAQEVIEMSAVFGKLHSCGYQWCSRSRKKYFDRCVWLACARAGWQACRSGYRPEQ